MQKRKLRPCDCKDIYTASYLQEQGIKHNDTGITVIPNHVIIEHGHTTMKMPMKLFEKLATWYLEEQEVEQFSNLEVDNDTSARGM